ncbi:MAG: NADP-dependent 3-hydroxy acid dehydrogenase YdfG [Phycisphaerales bacterium]|jgi:NADP-dependent 3-hydroxy acid dehydrogenase YdfG
MDTALNGRIAVVTGASAGIGKAIAEHLAQAGACVVLNARRADKLQQLAESINNATGRTAAVPSPGDAADPGVVTQMLDAAADSFGAPVDLAVVNAGRGLAGSIMTSDEAQWEEMVRVNLIGAARLMRYAGERMLAEAESGEESWPETAKPRDIVVLGSNVGRHISPYSSMYGASKFGVNSLAEAQRRELGPKGIRVSLLEPGIVKSEFQGVAGYDPKAFGEIMEKFGPVLDPEDIARTVVFITSQPKHVHLNDIVIRGTRQDYP